MTCCGKVFCSGCVLAESEEMNKGNIKRLCSFCREPIRVSNKIHIDRTKKRMEVKDALAFDRLGQAYLNGELGLRKDPKKALELHIQAAQLGSADGYYQIATAYKFGFGVEVDIGKSMHYLKLAAIGGDEIARYNLGSTESRQGNNKRAMKHFMIAARAGFDESLKVVGQGYKHGILTKDEYASTLRAQQVSVDEMKSEERTKAAKIQGSFKWR